MPLDPRAVAAALGRSDFSVVGDRVVFENAQVNPRARPEWDQAAYDAVAGDISDLVRAEVQRRILARASIYTQINMGAAAPLILQAAGKFTQADAAAYLDALAWIDAMRAKGQELTAARDPTFANNRHWPEPTAAAVALAAKF